MISKNWDTEPNWEKSSKKLLSDQIQEFIDWLEEMTEFGDWDEKIRADVHKKLIEVLTSK